MAMQIKTLTKLVETITINGTNQVANIENKVIQKLLEPFPLDDVAHYDSFNSPQKIFHFNGPGNGS